MKFIYGKEKYFVQQAYKNELKKYSQKPTIFRDNDDVYKIVEELVTYSMFDESKVIVISDYIAFTNEMMSKKLIQVLQNLDETINVIFVCKSFEPRKSNLLFKFLKANAECIYYDKLDTSKIPLLIEKFVHNRGGTISKESSMKVVELIGYDLEIIFNELTKLLHNNLNITKQNITHSLSRYIQEDYFELSNAIINANNKKIIQSYQNKIDLGNPPSLIINQIASTLSLALITNYFRNAGYSDVAIAEQYKKHPFQIKKISGLLSRTSIDKIEHLILNLAKLDHNIKSGNIVSNIGLDLFILELIR